MNEIPSFQLQSGIKVASFLKFVKKIAVGFKNLRKWGMLDNCSELLCTNFGAFWLKIVSAVNEKSDPSSITVSTKLSLRLKIHRNYAIHCKNLKKFTVIADCFVYLIAKFHENAMKIVAAGTKMADPLLPVERCVKS